MDQWTQKKVKSAKITQTNNVKKEHLDVEKWLFKYIRKEGNIKQLAQYQAKVQVKFLADQIELEGKPEEVKIAKTKLMDLIQDLRKQFACEEVKINSLFHSHIIGKNGGNVNKLKQDPLTLISIPRDGDIIRIEGMAEDVAQVKKALLDMVYDMEFEVTVDLVIEQRFHQNFLGAEGEKMQHIREKFNQVDITFPKPGLKSDKVSICGPKRYVENCYKYLKALYEEMKSINFSVDVPIYKRNYKVIIEEKEEDIKKIKFETNTRIDFSSEGSESNIITISGQKEDVLDAKCKILAIQEELGNMFTQEIMIPANLHDSIIGRKGELIRSIAEDCGDVSIKFPTETESDKISIHGPKEDVIKASNILLELSREKQQTSHTDEVEVSPDFHNSGVKIKKDSIITIECVIPQEYHGKIIGAKGSKVESMRRNFDVTIKIPDHKTQNVSDKQNIVTIKGKKENCEKAHQALLDLVPITEVVEIPYIFHSFIIGKKGNKVMSMKQFYDVDIIIPPQKEHSNFITIKGVPANVEKTKEALKEKVELLKTKKQDKLMKSFQLSFKVDTWYRPKIIGRNGSRITKIRQDYDVQVKIPEAYKKKTVITITGYEKNAKSAKKAILKLINEQENEEFNELDYPDLTRNHSKQHLYISNEEENENLVQGMESEGLLQKKEEEEIPVNEKEGPEIYNKTRLATSFILLKCRSIRIGSYEIFPEQHTSSIDVTLTEKSVRFIAPVLHQDKKRYIVINLTECDTIQMWIHFGKSLPVIFVYTSKQFGESVQSHLNRVIGNTALFDPTSDDMKKNKLMFLIDSFSEEQHTFMRQIFPGPEKLKEIDQDIANEILIKSTPEIKTKNSLSEEDKKMLRILTEEKLKDLKNIFACKQIVLKKK